jgi:preprotein translocase subunit SecE
MLLTGSSGNTVSSTLSIRQNIPIMFKNITAYIREAYDELMHKVTWPTWKELQSSALVVMVASFIIALIIFVMDISFEKVMEVIYGLFY